MAAELEATYEERASKDIASALALEEDKTKRILDKKEYEKEKINEELSVLQRETDGSALSIEPGHDIRN